MPLPFVLNEQPSIADHYIAQLRDKDVQQDRWRFRQNMERLGNLLAYEMSKQLAYESYEVETVLGKADSRRVQSTMVLGTILRAGLPFHQGTLYAFDDAENAFISAYRKHHKNGTFEIEIEYVSCPNLKDKILVIADPMLATGASMVLAVNALRRFGVPSEVHVLAAIAAEAGVDYVRQELPYAKLWLGAVDAELTAQSYIAPGLGDAGDLSYGEKIQR
ncbi:MAG: uracil phosphoribosyltransferase [Bacteroidota bacterium]